MGIALWFVFVNELPNINYIRVDFFQGLLTFDALLLGVLALTMQSGNPLLVHLNEDSLTLRLFAVLIIVSAIFSINALLHLTMLPDNGGLVFHVGLGQGKGQSSYFSLFSISLVIVVWGLLLLSSIVVQLGGELRKFLFP